MTVPCNRKGEDLRHILLVGGGDMAAEYLLHSNITRIMASMWMATWRLMPTRTWMCATGRI